MNRIIVGMADYAVVKCPTKVVTLGLGSCIGITLYDPHAKIGGLVHIMLPSIDQARSKDNKAKFADTGIEYLVEEMVKQGAFKRRLEAKIAGGASMFSFGNSQMKIGLRNAEMTRKVLKDLNIPIISEDTGDKYGRTIELDPCNGVLHVRSALKDSKEI